VQISVQGVQGCRFATTKAASALHRCGGRPCADTVPNVTTAKSQQRARSGAALCHGLRRACKKGAGVKYRAEGNT
jgi:hypothetical protein